MPHSSGPIRHLWLPCLVIATAIFFPKTVHAQTTTWFGSSGDWGTPSNWSDGEPTIGVDAIVTSAGTVMVTQAGEVCRNLSMSTVASSSTLQVQSGSLQIAQRLHIAPVGDASLQQSGGTLSADEIVVGSDKSSGACTVTGGILNFRKMALGSGTFTLTAGNPACTLAESLLVAPGANFICGAGTLNVGTTAAHGTLIDGVFTHNNLPNVSMRGFRMADSAILSINVGPLGISMITVAGTATLNGMLLVSEVLAVNGTYEVLRGNPLEGTFDSVFLPQDWTHRIEGNSLFLIKGPAAVEPSTWGRIKAMF